MVVLGVDVFLYGEHVRDRQCRFGTEQRSNLIDPVWIRETPGHPVCKIGREGSLISCCHESRGWVVDRRHLFEGYVAVPLIFARTAIERYITLKVPPDRYAPCCLVPNVPRSICIDEVLARSPESD